MIRFGTTTLPLAGWVADPRQPEQSRMHRLAAMRQVVERYHLRVLELTLDLGIVYPQVFDAGFYRSVAALQQELGFVCTVHLPFLWIDPTSANEPIRKASVACLRQAVALTSVVEAHAYILHLWGFPTRQIAAELKDPAQRRMILGMLMMQASRSLEELCELVEPHELCVENLEDSLFDLALPLIERHGVSICLDVGHLVWQGARALDFLDQHGDGIREVHLHDASTATAGDSRQVRDHLALGRGQIDYRAILHKLEEMGYDGPVILELNSRAELEESLRNVSTFL